MQYKKVEKIIENGKHKLLYDGIFVEDDPDYYEPEVEPEISEEKETRFKGQYDQDKGHETFQSQVPRLWFLERQGRVESKTSSGISAKV